MSKNEPAPRPEVVEDRRRLYRYKSRLERYKKAGKAAAKHPSFFVEGREYTSNSTAGHDPNMRYMCIYVSMSLVVFSFQFQGIERTMTVYHSDIKPEHWVQPGVEREG